MHLVRPLAQTPHGRHAMAGMSMVEILVTVMIVSIGLLGLASLQFTGLRQNKGSESRSIAALLAQDIVERMRTNPAGLAANLYTGVDTSTGAISCTLPAAVCANYNDGTARAAASCTNAQIATFDLFTWKCGLPVPASALRSGLTNALNNGKGTITCTDILTTDADPCTDGSAYTVVVSWDEVNTKQGTVNPGTATTNFNVQLVVVP